VEFARGAFEASLNFARETVKLQRSISADPHPAIGAGLNIASLALIKLGRLDEARVACDELLEEERRLTGEFSLRFNGFLTSKARLELLTGHVGDAIALLERASANFAHSVPLSNASALENADLLGAAYQLAGRWRDSRDLYAALLPVVDAPSATWKLRRLSFRLKYARALEALSDWNSIEAILDEALELAHEANIPGDDGLESQIAAALARALARRGDLSGAQSYMNSCVALRAGAPISSTTAAWTTLAEAVVARANGEHGRARELLEPLAKLEVGPSNADAVPAIARAQLAVLLDEVDAPRARQLGERTLVELTRMLGEEHPETIALNAWLKSAH
jgi:tetratricopeptide (TPR) repeat protein